MNTHFTIQQLYDALGEALEAGLGDEKVLISTPMDLLEVKSAESDEHFGFLIVAH